eukprot:TRINITY_DN3060_c0_g1_i4.p1 TRINITY_DN3060_c0_g1~~TRINITY_DN3060_c0_g1_i4.p1  ORF type:complete len:311 (+),score=51.60 TRINITY_DN3060_c0_g1_i4:31-933(+)
MSTTRNYSSQPEGDLLVDVKWLHKNVEDPKVQIIDCTWKMPNERNPHPRVEWEKNRILNARFFDIDTIATFDEIRKLPHMLPSVELFNKSMNEWGIENDDHVIVYDNSNQFFASARVWWTFRVFGHKKINILAGGVPQWNKVVSELGEPKVTKKKGHVSPYKASFHPELVKDLKEVMNNLETKKYQVIDARSEIRWRGLEKEPREGLRSGHIPNSFNVPFRSLIDKDGQLLPKQDLKGIFEKAGVDVTKPIITSCGSGVSAALLSMALWQLDNKNVSLYDGSWAEWGQETLNTPVHQKKD